MRDNLQTVRLRKLCAALKAWRKKNKTAWVEAIVIWNEMIDYNIPNPFDTLQQFRFGLRTLVELQPKIIESRKGPGGRIAQFKVIIKGGKYVVQPKPTKVKSEKNISEQVQEKEESYLWRKKYYDVKKLLDHSHKQNILQKLILDQIHKDIKALPPVKFTSFGSEKDRKRKKEEAMLIISDAHVGEYVSKAETGGLCEYDFDIYARSLQYIADTIDNLNKNKLGVGLTKLTVAVLGDMVSGNIHQELEITNEAHVVTQACMGGYVFSQFLRDISTMFPEVEVICLSGNHGRLQKEKRFKQKQLDWDRVYYEIAAAYSQNLTNVKFDISPSTYWVGDINGHTFLLFHGDHIRSWGGIPWYGVLRSVTSLKNQYAPHGKIIKYAVLGHFHTMGELADVHGDTILNGSFQGGNEFSALALSKVTYPGQHYFGIHPIIGRSWRYPLRLDTAPKDGPIRYKYDLNSSVADITR